MSNLTKMTMCHCRQALALAAFLFSSPSLAGVADGARAVQQVAQSSPLGTGDIEHQQPDVDIFALMSGKCTRLKIAGRDYDCRAVAFFHSVQGRAKFTIALEDHADDSHVVSFSGDNSRRPQDNLYELPIDRVLLNSKHSPKVDGLPVPVVQQSVGLCKQVGNFANRQVSSIACSATDNNGRQYELLFESDGMPMTVRRVRQSRPNIKDPFN
jgi:hypothetical protein